MKVKEIERMGNMRARLLPHPSSCLVMPISFFFHEFVALFFSFVQFVELFSFWIVCLVPPYPYGFSSSLSLSIFFLDSFCFLSLSPSYYSHPFLSIFASL